MAKLLQDGRRSAITGVHRDTIGRFASRLKRLDTCGAPKRSNCAASISPRFAAVMRTGGPEGFHGSGPIVWSVSSTSPFL